MSQKYLPSLDGIRACAFVLVFLAHAGLANAVPGGLGVTIFFFLSGYLITSLMRKEWEKTQHISLRKFYLRRAMRILPPLYLVIAISWTLDYFGIPARMATGPGLISVLFYYYNYAILAHLPGVNVPAGLGIVWSLMIEEHFYLLFPLVYLAFKKRAMSVRRTNVILGLACMAALAWRMVLVFGLHTEVTSGFSWTYAATDTRFDSILWGCILAIGANPWCGDRNETLEKYKGGLAIGGILLFLVTLTIREPHFRETIRYTLQGIALLPLFYYVVSSPGSWKSKWLTWAPLRWLGWVSYTMYLSHFLMLFIVDEYVHMHPVVNGLIAAVLSGLFAETVRRTVENPLRGMKQRAHLEVAANG